ncbi:MAG: acetyl/propionyl/methylcrotonyl-CoA carboxylase subunit alpha [Betaproteobacteria bacterium]|nr:acetyl/propionyl/methylcrotonyl-CoA carboxylase subunit alpha [Betaproteobacteria bacterium]
MFDKILIANRGEIAVRVARTCKRLGVRTVAVYSDADANALHVSACDEAFHIGPSAPRESYLKAERILEVAKATGVQAVHPGYGFLSENASFADAVSQAGLIFIGPPASAIRAMGSKSASKDIMHKAGVPLVPGYHGEAQDYDTLHAEAEKTGYPVLIKASAGGGGKGMRVVNSARELKEAIAGAKREAASSFGDDRLLIEKYLQRQRHIEVQVFADTRGNAVYLFERDCSVQRRHQKVLEEAPAPGLSATRRRQMGSTAVAAALAVDYTNAGTVEFIADEQGAFYFMEMNTRLQVEHPVTEMITGLDLVEWQLRVAAGEALPLTQEQLAIRGHAIEARIYAEDAAKGFLPTAGVIHHLRQPQPSSHVRVDTGVKQGDEIGVHYDPMIAKLIVWDRDRGAALRRMHVALAEYQVVGVTTNIDLLAAIVAHPAFAQAHTELESLDTGLIERHRTELIPQAAQPADRFLALAVLAELLRNEREAQELAARSNDPHSPWNATDGWRLNQDNHHRFEFTGVGSVVAHYRKGGYRLDLPRSKVEAKGEFAGDDALMADIAGARVQATVVRRANEITVFAFGTSCRLELKAAQAVQAEDAGGSLAAPMSGNIIQVLVKPGQSVTKAQALLILEAMKMEHTISAPAQGVVKEIFYVAGDQVKEGAQLLSIETAEGS